MQGKETVPMPLALILALIAAPAPASPTVGGAPDKPADALVAAKSAPGDQDAVRVRLRCIARATGVASDCVVIDETRPGHGFGAAALALMDGATVEPALDQGRPIDTPFEHTIQFTP